MNKSNTILLLASLASIALGVGATLGVSYGFGIDYGKNETQETENTEGLETEVTEVKNMVVKRLSAETLANGDTVQTFSYTITPENATNQNINTAVTYQDDSGEATEITASINTEEKTITLTCHSAFNKVILVTLTAADGGGATATITCNYQKKLLDLSYSGRVNTTDSNDIRQLILTYSNTNNVSEYTMDYDYSSESISSLSLNKNNLRVYVSSGRDAASDFEDFPSYDAIETSINDLVAEFERSITTSLNNNRFTMSSYIPDASDLWEIGERNRVSSTWSEFLQEYLQGSFEVGFYLEGSTLTVGDEVITASSSARFTYEINFDFSNYSLISSIDVSGADNVIF